MIKDFFQFVSASPSAFHAAEQLSLRLKDGGFEEGIGKNGAFFIQQDGTIAAYRPGRHEPLEGLRIIGAHTDSPGLKVRPEPMKRIRNYAALGVEVYGSPILETWIDRELGLAGVCHIRSNGKLESHLVDSKQAVGFIPSLAIHLRKTGDEPINKQKDINPLIMLQDASEKSFDFSKFLRHYAPSVFPSEFELFGFDLIFYDISAPSLMGQNQELISCPRLDNLASAFAGLSAFLEEQQPEYGSVFVAFNHEEIGSATHVGAAGVFLEHFLRSIPGASKDFGTLARRSFLMSADNAHAIHPSHPEKHDDNHAPLLNGGPVLKTNSAGRYITGSMSGAFVRMIAKDAGIPLQEFSGSNNIPCGSTIGPAVATRLGMAGADIGIPTLGMHSIRELSGRKDIEYLQRFLRRFLSSQEKLPS